MSTQPFAVTVLRSGPPMSDAVLALADFCRRIVNLAGCGQAPGQVPPAAVLTIARAGKAIARINRRPPLLALVELLLWEEVPVREQAQRQPGKEPVALDDGVLRTVQWLDAEDRLPRPSCRGGGHPFPASTAIRTQGETS